MASNAKSLSKHSHSPPTFVNNSTRDPAAAAAARANGDIGVL